MQATGWVVPSWVVPLVTIIGSCIVSLSNYAVQRWRYGADRLTVAIDHLCGEINAAARRASDYWLLGEGADNDRQQRELELIGLQDRIQQLISAVQEQDPKLDLDAAAASVMDLFDSMTGGAFRVSGRGPDLVRAGRVYTVAAALTGQLRIAVARRVRSFWG